MRDFEADALVLAPTLTRSETASRAFAALGVVTHEQLEGETRGTAAVDGSENLSVHSGSP